MLYGLADPFFSVILIKVSKTCPSRCFCCRFFYEDFFTRMDFGNFSRIYFLEWAIFRFSTVFFLAVFFSHDIYDSEDSSGRGRRLFLSPLYHFHHTLTGRWLQRAYLCTCLVTGSNRGSLVSECKSVTTKLTFRYFNLLRAVKK